MKKRQKISIRIIKILSCLIVLWLITGFLDYWRVCKRTEKPIFAVPIKYNDGSGRYQGLGYSVEVTSIEYWGKWQPTYEANNAEYYWFGIYIKTVGRVYFMG